MARDSGRLICTILVLKNLENLEKKKKKINSRAHLKSRKANVGQAAQIFERHFLRLRYVPFIVEVRAGNS